MTTRALLILLTLGGAVAFGSGCGSDGEAVPAEDEAECEFEDERTCEGDQGCLGTQICAESETWGPCVCNDGSGGSTSSGGMSAGGSAQGGVGQGGSAQGGVGQGGSAQGGVGQGGSAQGGVGQGGSAQGGVGQGGSAQGGAGGSSGAGGSGGSGPLPGVDQVACGSEICSLPGNQLCCVDDPLIGQTTVSCATSDQGCNRVYRCDGNEDCPGVCCGVKGFTGGWEDIECSMTCDGNDVPFGCTGPQNCGAGEVCCGTTEPNNIPFQPDNYVSTECASTCAGPILCSSDGDCVTGGTCQATDALPDGIKECVM